MFLHDKLAFFEAVRLQYLLIVATQSGVNGRLVGLIFLNKCHTFIRVSILMNDQS